MSAAKKTLVIRNGTLIDGSGKPSARNDAIVVEGNRIKSVGALPGDIHLEDRKNVDVVDALGKWIMPGLIDAHCHMSYGYPLIKGEGKGKGTTRPEFSTLKSARSAQKVLRSGVTSISVPGGTWFTDVGVRDAIRLGLMEGPRMFVAGRMIVTYGCIEDDEPSWEGTPDHSIGKLCNTADEMVTEVRRQGKEIELQPREFQLLEFLMRHAGQSVTRTMLLEKVWEYHFDPQTNVIDVHISRLRSKIDKGFERPMLQTVRGAGYRLDP